MHTTRKILEELLTDIISKTGLRLQLDHNSIYGGYVIREMKGDSGGYRPFVTDNRKSTSRMYDFLIGFINGMNVPRKG